MENGLKKEVTILIAEDDDGHAELICDNLRESGLHNPIIRFANGQESLDFFFGKPGHTCCFWISVCRRLTESRC